jgi:hypothetical protein
MVTGLLGANRECGPTFELFLGDSRGRGLRPRVTLGLDPNPVYFGLKLADADGGRSGDFPGLFSPSWSWWMRADSLEENSGERTSTLSDGDK